MKESGSGRVNDPRHRPCEPNDVQMAQGECLTTWKGRRVWGRASWQVGVVSLVGALATSGVIFRAEPCYAPAVSRAQPSSRIHCSLDTPPTTPTSAASDSHKRREYTGDCAHGLLDIIIGWVARARLTEARALVRYTVVSSLGQSE
jgi:hypothetical protein